MKPLSKEMLRQKREYQTLAAEQRETLCREPFLRYLFFELTMRCNERCLHCGSLCGDVKSEELPLEVYKRILDEVKAEFSPRLPCHLRRSLCQNAVEVLACQVVLPRLHLEVGGLQIQSHRLFGGRTGGHLGQSHGKEIDCPPVQCR